MAWMQYLCGRLEMRYRYSNTIVYNNFPWPSATEKQKQAIMKEAQGVLEARKIFPELSLAELYDTTSMLPELVLAHQKLDKAVEASYGRTFVNDSERIAYLFELYKKLTGTDTPLIEKSKKTGKGKKTK
jgi:hypothetical protein